MTRFKSNNPFIVKLTGMTDYCQKADTFVWLGYILAVCLQTSVFGCDSTSLFTLQACDWFLFWEVTEQDLFQYINHDKYLPLRAIP